MIPIKTASAWRGTADCRHCGIRQSVLFADLKEEDFDLIHAPIDDLSFDAGAVLVQAGEAVKGVMTLRTGMVKLVRVSSDGRARIVRVLRPGDVIGLEALAAPVYEADVVALTPVGVCRIPGSVIQRLNQDTPRLHHQLMQKWHRSLREADDWLAELNFGSAQHRVAQLALKMRSADDPTLTTLFAREDMGSMLDLKLETVSRAVNHFVRAGWLEPLDRLGRRYRVLDAAALAAVE
ncbi:MAG: Crp/Fnr family transcriptional regulator [Rubrivivax sp.]|nr:Crp/Fnr family transcriptional regulator [Rubrivivax sp.]